MSKAKLVIPRAQWLNPNNPRVEVGPGKIDISESSRLLAAGLRCCLGFECQRCGVPDVAMRQVGSPAKLIRSYQHHVEHLLRLRLGPGQARHASGEKFDNEVTVALLTVNDNCEVTAEYRERKIIDLFTKLDIEVEFTGSYEK